MKKEKYVTGVVIWPGKDWDNKPEYGGGKRTSSTFTVGEEEVKVNSSNPESPKAKFLKGLRKGQEVPLVFNEARGDIPAFYDIDTWAVIGSGGGGGSPSAKKETKGFMEAFADSRKRAKWFVEQGSEMASEIYGNSAANFLRESEGEASDVLLVDTIERMAIAH